MHIRNNLTHSRKRCKSADAFQGLRKPSILSKILRRKRSLSPNTNRQVDLLRRSSTDSTTSMAQLQFHDRLDGRRQSSTSKRSNTLRHPDIANAFHLAKASTQQQSPKRVLYRYTKQRGPPLDLFSARLELVNRRCVRRTEDGVDLCYSFLQCIGEAGVAIKHCSGCQDVGKAKHSQDIYFVDIAEIETRRTVLCKTCLVRHLQSQTAVSGVNDVVREVLSLRRDQPNGLCIDKQMLQKI